MKNSTYNKMLLDFRRARNNYKVGGDVSQLYKHLTENVDLLVDEETLEYFMKDVAKSFFDEHKTISEWKSFILNASKSLHDALEKDKDKLKSGELKLDNIDEDSVNLFECILKIIKEETSLIDETLLKRDINGQQFADLILDFKLFVDISQDKVNFTYK